MEDDEGGVEALVVQVEPEVAEVVGRDQALVDDGAERARGHVRAGGGGLDALAHAEGGPLVLGRVGQYRLQEAGLELLGLLAQLIVVGGRLSPVDDLDALFLGRRFD